MCRNPSEIWLDQCTTARWALAGLPAKKMLLFNSVPLISKFRNPSEISLDQYTTARWALAGLPAKKMLLFNSMPPISKCRNPYVT
jgi:hypothetical protein